MIVTQPRNLRVAAINSRSTEEHDFHTRGAVLCVALWARIGASA